MAFTFKKTNYILIGKENENIEEKKESVSIIPEGMWMKCVNCGDTIYTEDVENNNHICPKCGYNFRIDANHRLEMVLDEESFVEWDKDLKTTNPLQFEGYEEKIAGIQKKTGLSEGIITGEGKIHGQRTAIGVCDSRFLMGSMGEVVGEKIVRMFEKATAEKIPVVIFACSGGARMQEGIISLMQMAKTSQAIKRHNDAGQLYISVLTDPTTGGVTASFAMLGDIILAEPGALIGFAGPRVIEQTIGQKLPEGFQRSEFLLQKGFIDAIVNRTDLKDTLSEIIRMHTPQQDMINTYSYYQKKNAAIASIPFRKKATMGAWEKVQVSRSATRPTALDYISHIFKDFMEFHGDRHYGDDGAIVGGIATLGGMPVTVIAQQKGKNTKENILRNFGMPAPEGYRKALRLMKEAERFKRPIICFVDTPGAFCGIEAEERGQGEAIAKNLYEMSGLKVPVLTIVIGEGGSGGALAMAVSNEVYMMENATYSILSPEGFASILWKDSKRASEAAQVMKITAGDLLELKVVEKVIPEVKPAGEENLADLTRYMRCYIKEFLAKYKEKDEETIVNERYDRFRKF
ncbi:MAG: acetyl-CoA carboxylase, carboxyltransferase subunit beta [Lachnospiraceae bacterium]|nr:acetyl-CoA carboxylase, carboxyltransferase subunit beta [Lachnospiraceae bacterium]